MTTGLQLRGDDPEAADARARALRLIAAWHSEDNETAFGEIGLVLGEMAADPDRLLFNIAHLVRAFTRIAHASTDALSRAHDAEFAATLLAIDEALAADDSTPR
jgi:hypothetical protein